MFFFDYCGLADTDIRQREYMTTTPATPHHPLPEPIYRRLDMARLPPYRLERIPNADLEFGCPIRFKNVWNDETEAQRVADKEKADMVRTVTRRTQTKSTKMRCPFCKFCMHRGFPLAVCKSHYTKSGPEFGSKITCPLLLQQQCARCGEIGHTPKYCKSEHWLKTNPRDISSYRNPLDINWFHLSELAEDRISLWQKPIPPALQKRHEEYEERCVKHSRIWIEMTGDHKHYTNDFRIIMVLNESDDWFRARPRTEYETKVQEHYEWMRTVMWDETPQNNCIPFVIMNSPPPSYEEATAAAELLQAVTPQTPTTTTPTTHAAGSGSELGSIIQRLPESARIRFESDCAKTMHDIITKYIEHQTK